jgi:hypothetical protein
MDECGNYSPARLLHMLSDQLFDLLLMKLKDERGTHIETAISAAAGLAGVTLIRNCGEINDKLEPGTPIISDKISRKQADMVDFFKNAANSMGMTPDKNWDLEIPELNLPMHPVEELVMQVEEAFQNLVGNFPIGPEMQVKIAALTAMKLAKAGSNLVSDSISKAIIMKSFMGSSSMVPLPAVHEPVTAD